MATTTGPRRVAAVTALLLTAMVLVGCREHPGTATPATTTVSAAAPSTGSETATTAAGTIDPQALADLQHDLDAATADLDAADQQLQAADTESTTDTRG